MRKKRHEEHVNHERWLVSYADFITLLFAFFTTLYAISTVDQKKVGQLMYSMRTAFDIQFFPSEYNVSSAKDPSDRDEDSVEALTTDGEAAFSGEGEVEKFHEAVKALLAIAAEEDMVGKLDIRIDDRGAVISLSEAHFFPSGAAEVSPQGLPTLDRVAGFLATTTGELVVEGHTDTVPIANSRYRSNWELSTARATTVVAFFIEKHKIPAIRISAAGYAEFRPVADNLSVNGRARNRRVDIVLRAPSDMALEAVRSNFGSL